MGKDNEKNMPLGPRLMKLPNKCMHTFKEPLSRCENVSKAIRKKGYNAHGRLNGLATNCVSKGNNKVYG